MSSDANAIVQTIQRMYAAVGVDDRAGLDAVLCRDFHAFDNGVRMTGRELLDLMSRYYAEGKRCRGSVTGEQVEVQGILV